MALEAHIRGGEQSGLRAYNRRLILSVIRRSGPLPKVEIARITGLTAQSASVIVNALLEEGLVRKEGKVRGRVGQPTTPIALNPHGALSLGVKIGRRSLEIALVDFLGQALQTRQVRYDAPRRREVMTTLDGELEALLGKLDPALRRRIVGVGLAAPGDLAQWAEAMGLDPDALADWANVDLSAELEARTGLPVDLWNDATAACAAEMMLGEAMTFSSGLYIYIGAFIGGGVVLDGRLHAGIQGNAGAIGSMPISLDGGGFGQLIRLGSLVYLERALPADTGEARLKVRAARDGEVYLSWRAAAARAIAEAISVSRCVIDFEGVVIDAMLDAEDVAGIVEAVRAELAGFDDRGMSPIELRAGALGSSARALGAAILPLVRNFSPDQQLLIKGAPDAARIDAV